MPNDHEILDLDTAVAEAIGWDDWQTINGKRAFARAPGTLHDEWEPSKRIDHAWQLMQRLVAAGWQVDLASTLANEWTCILRREGRGWEVTDPPCRAICRVTIRALVALRRDRQ